MKPNNDKMGVFKKVFFVLLVLDLIGLILTGINLFPMFRRLAGYGRLMLIVASVMVVMAAAVLMLEILAKILLIRSTSPAFSWSSGRKGCVAAAILVLLFNLGAILVNMLSAGGEGATLINQGYLYLRVLASAAEIVTAIFYLRTVKRLA